jgi:PAS domain-containing protein
VTNRFHDSRKGIIANFREVTTQKNIELKLKQNEKYFRALVENNDGIICTDENLKTIFVVLLPRITGYS